MMTTTNEMAIPETMFAAALVMAALAEPETAPEAEIVAPTAYNKTEVTKMTTTKSSTSYPFLSKAQIQERVKSDPEFRIACLEILFARQTAYEQSSETTLNRNKQGFMSSHAVHGCRIAKKVRAGEELTAEDHAKVQEIVPRYGRQLAEHFRHEAALKAAAAVFGV